MSHFAQRFYEWTLTAPLEKEQHSAIGNGNGDAGTKPCPYFIHHVSRFLLSFNFSAEENTIAALLSTCGKRELCKCVLVCAHTWSSQKILHSIPLPRQCGTRPPTKCRVNWSEFKAFRWNVAKVRHHMSRAKPRACVYVWMAVATIITAPTAAAIVNSCGASAGCLLMCARSACVSVCVGVVSSPRATHTLTRNANILIGAFALHETYPVDVHLCVSFQYNFSGLFSVVATRHWNWVWIYSEQKLEKRREVASGKTRVSEKRKTKSQPTHTHEHRTHQHCRTHTNNSNAISPFHPMCRATQTHTHTLTVVVRIRKKCMTKDGDFRFAVYYSLSACCVCCVRSTLYGCSCALLCLWCSLTQLLLLRIPMKSDIIPHRIRYSHFSRQRYISSCGCIARSLLSREGNSSTETQQQQQNRKQNTEFGNSVSEYMVDMVLWLHFVRAFIRLYLLQTVYRLFVVWVFSCIQSGLLNSTAGKKRKKTQGKTWSEFVWSLFKTTRCTLYKRN